MSRLDTAREAARENARLLHIPVPRIRLASSSEFPTATTRAAADEAGSEIAINRDMDMGLYDLWFVTSHEMRHLWQMRSGDPSVSQHVQSSSVSTAEYNRQPHEIDANAWAVLIMESTFGVTPMLANNVGSEIYAAIRRRAEEIADKFGKEENNDIH